MSQVLFCGHDMHYGYVFTHEALQAEEGVEVRRPCRRRAMELAQR